jgi:integrase/recombinase XerD
VAQISAKASLGSGLPRFAPGRSVGTLFPATGDERRLSAVDAGTWCDGRRCSVGGTVPCVPPRGHPKLLRNLVGPPRFELGTSCTPSKRASQAAPRPEESMTYEENKPISLLAFTERFIKERQYMKGVSPATVEWYRQSFKAFAPVLERPYQCTTDLKAAIIEHIGQVQTAGRGNKAVSINTYLRCLRAFLRWAHEEKIVKEPVKLNWLKEEEKILSTFTPLQIQQIVNRKPVGRNETRIRMAAITAMDTGMRFQELLNLRRADVDFDNLTFRVNGKGKKQRLVPMSVELRKLLFRYLSQHQFDRVFCTGSGGEADQRYLLRDFKLLCSRLDITGVRCSFHTLRHSFAVNYLRAGGNLYYLQRILGHSSITTTERYLRSLGIDDLKKVHDGLSLLSR